MPSCFDLEGVRKATADLLRAIGEDPHREGLQDTPRRVADAYAQISRGLHADPRPLLATRFQVDYREIVLVKNIDFYSLCEHHLLPFFGQAHVAYLPGTSGSVVGLSKLVRLVECLAAKPQVQERLTREVAKTLETELQAAGVMVVLEAQHLCMSMRGVRQSNATTLTTAHLGVFADNTLDRNYEESSRDRSTYSVDWRKQVWDSLHDPAKGSTEGLKYAGFGLQTCGSDPRCLGIKDLNRPLIMGILNVTPDSFSDGGRYLQADKAVEQGLAMAAAGADLIDVGGESTRPGSHRVDPETELARIRPVVKELVEAGLKVSIDTINAVTAAACAELGAVMINDVSGGLADPDMHSFIADSGVLYVAQHWRGDPRTMNMRTQYQCVTVEVLAHWEEIAAQMLRKGISPQQVILDPGFGFGKEIRHDWSLLANLQKIVANELGCPILVGTSRKRSMKAVVDSVKNSQSLNSLPTTAQTSSACDIQSQWDERDIVTTATTMLAGTAGVWGVRVHNVEAAKRALTQVCGAEHVEQNRK